MIKTFLDPLLLQYQWSQCLKQYSKTPALALNHLLRIPFHEDLIQACLLLRPGKY